MEIKQLDDRVIEILQYTDSNGCLVSRERTDLEFKESYNERNWSKYAKTMAAFANHSGGFILIGISDSPRKIVGVSDDFDCLKQEKFTDLINSRYEPEILYEIGLVQQNGLSVGYIYTYESDNKPIIAKANDNSVRVNAGDILYRYRGQSTKIKYPELRRLLDEKVENERNNLIKMMSEVIENGTANVSIVNVKDGSFRTPNGVPIKIEKQTLTKILKRAKYIKEGSFNETDGDPVLRIIGDLEIAEEVEVPDINFNEKYPYTTKDIGNLLDLDKYIHDVGLNDIGYLTRCLISKYQLFNDKKFHYYITSSNGYGISKYSNETFAFLKKKIDEQEDVIEFLKGVRAEQAGKV